MLSSPSRTHLLSLSLVLVGLFFCTIGYTGVTDTEGANTYSVSEVRDSCDSSSTATYEFSELSPRAQAFFLETLNRDSSEAEIGRETPREFTVHSEFEGEIEPGNGAQYVQKEDQCYRLEIRTPGGLDFTLLYIEVTRFFAGVVLALAGVVSYIRSTAVISSALLGASAVFVIGPLLWLIGLFRWSMLLNRNPAVNIIVAILLSYAAGARAAHQDSQ